MTNQKYGIFHHFPAADLLKILQGLCVPMKLRKLGEHITTIKAVIKTICKVQASAL